MQQTGKNKIALKQVAWAISYRQSLERFNEEAPCQVYYSQYLDSNDANSLQRFDILEEVDAMGRRKTYVLSEWVQTLFEQSDWYTNFGKDALYKLNSNAELIATLNDEGQGFGVGDANSLSSMNTLVEYDNGTWRASDKLQKLQQLTTEINDG